MNIKFNLSLNDSCVLKDIIFLFFVATVFKPAIYYHKKCEIAQINNICIA